MKDIQETKGLFEAINSFIESGNALLRELKFNHGKVLGLNFLGGQELRVLNILIRGSAPQKRKFSSVSREKLEEVFLEESQNELDWERFQLSIENLLNVKIAYPLKFLKLHMEHGCYPDSDGFYPILEGLKILDSTLFWNLNDCTIVEAMDEIAA